jgi:hypothetical protein
MRVSSSTTAAQSVQRTGVTPQKPVFEYGSATTKLGDDTFVFVERWESLPSRKTRPQLYLTFRLQSKGEGLHRQLCHPCAYAGGLPQGQSS